MAAKDKVNVFPEDFRPIKNGKGPSGKGSVEKIEPSTVIGEDELHTRWVDPEGPNVAHPGWPDGSASSYGAEWFPAYTPEGTAPNTPYDKGLQAPAFPDKKKQEVFVDETPQWRSNSRYGGR